MKLTLTSLTVAATMFAGSASAFDPDDLQKLKNTNECAKCDLTGANLTGANMNRANLIDTDLSGAYLYGAIMKGVIFCNTTMPDGSVIYSGC